MCVYIYTHTYIHIYIYIYICIHTYSARLVSYSCHRSPDIASLILKDDLLPRPCDDFCDIPCDDLLLY